MRQKRQLSHQEISSEENLVNLTPLIDVVFVVLILYCFALRLKVVLVKYFVVKAYTFAQYTYFVCASVFNVVVAARCSCFNFNNFKHYALLVC